MSFLPLGCTFNVSRCLLVIWWSQNRTNTWLKPVMPSSVGVSSQSRNICERCVLSRISSPLASVFTMPIGFMFIFCSNTTFAYSLSSEYLGVAGFKLLVRLFCCLRRHEFSFYTVDKNGIYLFASTFLLNSTKQVNAGKCSPLIASLQRHIFKVIISQENWTKI